jgi:THO complex subunit 7
MNYSFLHQKIATEIEKAQARINEKKLELEDAKKVRKNRQEYDLMARQILQYTDRDQMKAQIQLLQEKSANLKKIDAEYDKKLELRRKQFSVVLQSLSSLKNLIESDQIDSDDVDFFIKSNGSQEDSTADTITIDSQEQVKNEILKTTGRSSNNRRSHHEKYDNEIEMDEA